MSNTPQPPADGWQPPPPQPEQPVYRPDEQPPAEEPPPWSPDSQRMPPMSQQMQGQPIEDQDGTVKYGGPVHQQGPPFAAPPGVPVSPFDSPAPSSSIPVSGPTYGPVSSIPTSGPVSPGQGQFGPQGGQLVPMSGVPNQAWGGVQQQGPIQRKKRGGGKGPMWFLLIGIVVIAGGLGAGGYFLFNPGSDEPNDNQTAVIDTPDEVTPALVADDTTGFKFVVADGAAWQEIAEENPAVFTTVNGRTLEDSEASTYIGELDAAALGITEDSSLDDIAAAFNPLVATHLGGEISGEVDSQTYRIDAREARFLTYAVGETTVVAALVDTGESYAAFIGFGSADEAEMLVETRNTLRFGEL